MPPPLSPSAPTWQDRRGMFQKGRELHQPAGSGRAASVSSTTSASSAAAARRFSDADRARLSSTSSASGGDKAAKTAADQRRASTAAGGGLFANLTTAKRGSEQYGQRQAGYQEMMGARGGVVGGWFDKTFRGWERPGAAGGGGGDKK